MATKYASVTVGYSVPYTFVLGGVYGVGAAESGGLFYTYDFYGPTFGSSIKNFAVPVIGYGSSKSSIQDLTGYAVGVDLAIGIGVQFSAGISFTDTAIPLPYFSGYNAGGAEASFGGSLGGTYLSITSGPYVAVDGSTNLPIGVFGSLVTLQDYFAANPGKYISLAEVFSGSGYQVPGIPVYDGISIVSGSNVPGLGATANPASNYPFVYEYGINRDQLPLGNGQTVDAFVAFGQTASGRFDETPGFGFGSVTIQDFQGTDSGVPGLFLSYPGAGPTGDTNFGSDFGDPTLFPQNLQVASLDPFAGFTSIPGGSVPDFAGDGFTFPAESPSQLAGIGLSITPELGGGGYASGAIYDFTPGQTSNPIFDVSAYNYPDYSPSYSYTGNGYSYDYSYDYSNYNY